MFYKQITKPLNNKYFNYRILSNFCFLMIGIKIATLGVYSATLWCWYTRSPWARKTERHLTMIISIVTLMTETMRWFLTMKVGKLIHKCTISLLYFSFTCFVLHIKLSKLFKTLYLEERKQYEADLEIAK